MPTENVLTYAANERMQGLSARIDATIQSIQSTLSLYEPGPDGHSRPVALQITEGFPARVWLVGRGIRLALPVDMQRGDGETLASTLIGDIPIFGVGESFVEAIEDLRIALADHLAMLNDAGDDLTDDLRAQRDLLRIHLEAAA